MFRIGKPEADAAARVISSGSMFRYGGEYNEVASFEKEFSEKMGITHTLMVSTGTAALTAALVGMGIGPGDEVIVPGYTFMATAIAVLAVGAIPVLAEIDESLTIDITDVEKKISPATKAVIPVHIQGFSCNMDKLVRLCGKRNIMILEDACQAIGGTYRGKRLGTIGACGVYSFNNFKIISAGEGGSVITNDARIFERASIYHDGGIVFRPHGKDLTEPVFSGTNMRASEVTGAIMREQLKRLEDILYDLRRVKRTIMDAVKNIPGIKFNPNNDVEGDCGVCLPFMFDDIAAAEKFEELTGFARPINTDKHVYSNWLPVLEKRGAFNPAFNPYNNPLNKELQLESSVESCPKTLDILSRSVYLLIHCDWDDAAISEKTETIITAAKSL